MCGQRSWMRLWGGFPLLFPLMCGMGVVRMEAAGMEVMRMGMEGGCK